MLLRQKCDNIKWLKLTAEQRQNDPIMQQWQSELRMVTVEFKQELKLESTCCMKSTTRLSVIESE